MTTDEKNFLGSMLVLLFGSLVIPFEVFAGTNPLRQPNNRFGIHIIEPNIENAVEAAKLVNSNGGDWGYVTVVLRFDDRNKNKWQAFFGKLRELHLIPIVRLATKMTPFYWERPKEEDAEGWSQFLDSLNWPVKNRYVIVYNEPNHAREWGGGANPAEYAKILNQTIDVLKAKNGDFFILNAGIDASAPHNPPFYYDAQRFLLAMNAAVPGIFDKLDGWASHSYPNPGFAGSPAARGRGTVKNYEWERKVLKNLGTKYELPVFITETGWVHSDGVKKNPGLPSPSAVAGYFEQAFRGAWARENIVAVTPFTLNYPAAPFDIFSFIRSQASLIKPVLGAQTQYLPQYGAVSQLPKLRGEPEQEKKAKFVDPDPPLSSREKSLKLTFENTGQATWETQGVYLVVLIKNQEGGVRVLPLEKEVRSAEKYTFTIDPIKKTRGTKLELAFNLYYREDPMLESPGELTLYSEPQTTPFSNLASFLSPQ